MYSMKNQLKTLHIPYVPELDDFPIENIDELMDDNAVRQAIEVSAHEIPHA